MSTVTTIRAGKFSENYYLISGVNNSVTFYTHYPKRDMIGFAGYPIYLFLKGSGYYDRDWAGVGKRK